VSDPVTDIRSQLLRDEAVRNFPYTDTKGKLTIGVGHNLTDRGLSAGSIDFILSEDIVEVVTELRTRLPWFSALDEARRGVLINMCFNLGFSKLEGFPKFLAAAAQGDWNTAAEEMLSSAWAKEVGERADRLAEQMTTGEWK